MDINRFKNTDLTEKTVYQNPMRTQNPVRTQDIRRNQDHMRTQDPRKPQAYFYRFCFSSNFFV